MAELDFSGGVSLTSSTAQGVAAGSPFGPWGMAIGGGIGFLSSLAGLNASNASEQLMELQAQRQKLSAIELNKIKAIERQMLQADAAKQRRQIQQNVETTAGSTRALLAQRGARGGTAAAGAEASLTGGLLTNFQTNLLSEQVGLEISNIQQTASDIQSGVTGPQYDPAKDKVDLDPGGYLDSLGDFIRDPSLENFGEAFIDQTPIGLGSTIVSKLTNGTVDPLSGGKFVNFVKNPSLDDIDKPSISQFGDWLSGK